MNINEILKRIISVRKSKGFTQKQLSEHLGICQFNYLKVEKGTTELTINRLIQIAEFLQVDPAYFLKNDNDSIIDSSSPKVSHDMNATIKLIIDNLSKGKEIEITQYCIKTISKKDNQA